MQQKLSQMTEMPIYADCPVCGERQLDVFTEVDRDHANKISMTMPQICDKCFDKGWRWSIDGDLVRLRFIYDTKQPWIIKEFVVIDRRGRNHYE